MDAMFMGEYNHSIDAKGRMIVPAKFRDQLGNEFVVTKGLDGCLFVYSNEEWHRIEENLRDNPLTSREARKFMRFFFAGAATCEVDKQGRILLPANLREYAEPNVVVALVGNKSDLVNLREVNREDAQAFALKNSLEYVETSALTGENVNLAFESLAKKIFFLKMEKSKLKAKDERKGSEVTTSHKLVALTKNKKKGCC